MDYWNKDYVHFSFNVPNIVSDNIWDILLFNRKYFQTRIIVSILHIYDSSRPNARNGLGIISCPRKIYLPTIWARKPFLSAKSFYIRSCLEGRNMGRWKSKCLPTTKGDGCMLAIESMGEDCFSILHALLYICFDRNVFKAFNSQGFIPRNHIKWLKTRWKWSPSWKFFTLLFTNQRKELKNTTKPILMR